MKEIEPEIVMSALSQPIERDGKRVQVDIYGDGDGGWLLEVVDEYGNSNVWNDSFRTEKAALAEAFETVEQDGIDSLIGLPPPPPGGQDLGMPLNDAELNYLQRFLIDGPLQETSMDVATLEGFLTAIAIGPCMVPPSQWFPWVWDMFEGKVAPDFDTKDQAERIFTLLMRQYNTVLRAFAMDPFGFQPLFLRGGEHGVRAWCEGFLLGGRYDQAAWQRLAKDQPDWLNALLALGGDDDDDHDLSEEEVDFWTKAVPPSLALIHDHWRAAKLPPAAVVPARSGPKVGRNDPCPCGSGKKFKKCCGADAAPTTLH